jgi:hypothetical protein
MGYRPRKSVMGLHLPRFSLKRLFGFLTILCIGLAVSRKPLLYLWDTNFFHNLLACLFNPLLWVFDLGLITLDMSRPPGPHVFGFLVGIILSVFLNLGLAIGIISLCFKIWSFSSKE